MSKHGQGEKKGGDSSYSKSVDAVLRETVGKGYPDPSEVDNPMIAS